MFYAIYASDIEDSIAKREKTRESHLAYVKELVQEGRVLLAGPHPAIDSPEPGPAGMSGSLIAAEFNSLQAAEKWAAHDPYARAGVFERVDVRPFLKVFP